MNPPDASKIDSVPHYLGERIFSRQRRWFATSLACSLSVSGIKADAPKSPIKCIWNHAGFPMIGGLGAYCGPACRHFAPWVIRASLDAAWSRHIPQSTLKRIGLKCQDTNSFEWKLEVTILPAELDFSFIGWLAAWIACRDDESRAVPKPPHGIICDRTHDYAWSPAAGSIYDAYQRRVNEIEQQRKPARAGRLARTGAAP